MTKNGSNTAKLTKAFAVHPFPLGVLAESPRASAFVIMQRPFYIARQLYRLTPTVARRQMIRRQFQRVLAELEPKTLLHVNGTRWRFDTTRAPRTAGSIAMTVRAACAFLGCSPTRTAVVNRIIDAYPDLEPRLRPVTLSRRRDDRVRAIQPLLAAMIVAHAASVAHLMKYG